jgi:hypothetical protein
MKTRQAALLAAALAVAGGCCGGPGGSCRSARAGGRPHAAEFIFSNLCRDGGAVAWIDLTVDDVVLHYPEGGVDAAPEEPVGYGGEIYLQEAYFYPGSYRLKVVLGFSARGGKGGERVEGEETIRLDGPSTVEIMLRRKGEGCGIELDVMTQDGGPARCYEPQEGEEAADIPPC